MHMPVSSPKSPPGAHASVLLKHPPATHPYIPASFTKEGCNSWCTSPVMGWGQAEAPFEISCQVLNLELSQPKSSSIETKTHSYSLTLVRSCSNHVNDSSLGFWGFFVTFTLESLLDADLYHAGSFNCPQPFPPPSYHSCHSLLFAQLI